MRRTMTWLSVLRRLGMFVLLILANSLTEMGRPCYIALKNNVSTIEMELSTHSWNPGTEEFVPHHVLADYIRDTARANHVEELIQFNTRVTDVKKQGSQWTLGVDKIVSDGSRIAVESTSEGFDALVIATGHYHAPNVPDLPGLAEWKRKFPDRVWHSKLYRRPDAFKNQNILLIGAGVSSLDIAKDLADVATSVYQSSRGGMYDLPGHLLPDNTARVGAIQSFDELQNSELTANGTLPGTITLQSGQKLCDIHQVIVATGYHVSFPCMREFHRDGVRPEDADERALVTNGQVTHNLHKDIWYIPDPTLAFVGVPYHIATFSLFEFQAMAIAQVFGGRAGLPSEEAMREEYVDRVQRKGAGRTLHSLKGYGQELEYVRELVSMVNEGNPRPSDKLMIGHSTNWLEAYERRRKRHELMFGKERDPEINRRILERVAGC